MCSHAAALPSDPLITPPPTLELHWRQEGVGPNFIGYTSWSGNYYPQSCVSGSTLSRSSSWAACRPTTASTFIIATDCESSSILLAPNTQFPCGSNLCYTIYVYSDLNTGSAPATVYACDTVSRKVTLYEETTGGAESSSSTQATASSTASSTTSNPIPSATARSTSISSTTTSSSSVIPTDSVTDPSPTSSRNLAWIAGPVVGGIAGAIIIGLGIWIVILLRRRQQSTQDHTYAQDFSGAPPMTQYMTYQSPGPSPIWTGPQHVSQQMVPTQDASRELYANYLPNELHGEHKTGVRVDR
ncbi:uncharacterized protein JN550_005277 [Neoarthrinium moseri]|uniref:uncharacterized protein n=1 Tax=Neoarthrinium moseri TaxID=1658444 RepID=UPI001FDC9382|nr:uncharacterized protein JN550_005277 [Neoarthrinium moseri]KAI1870349.1 hypothetical protein JN550_005277 [Neoarthrinium moseri]